VPEAERRAVIAGRLPRHSWPTRKLAVVAVEAHTGDVRVFDKDSGADLVDAVTASCAIPGIWPPVTIGAGRYIDGGTRSAVNADLAAGYQRVLILAPMADPPLDEQVAGLTRAAGAGSVLVLAPDDESLAAMGINPLDPAVRAPVAQAGYAQGERAAAGVARLWQLPGR
jgi:NTE family protein